VRLRGLSGAGRRRKQEDGAVRHDTIDVQQDEFDLLRALFGQFLVTRYQL